MLKKQSVCPLLRVELDKIILYCSDLAALLDNVDETQEEEYNDFAAKENTHKGRLQRARKRVMKAVIGPQPTKQRSQPDAVSKAENNAFTTAREEPSAFQQMYMPGAFPSQTLGQLPYPYPGLQPYANYAASLGGSNQGTVVPQMAALNHGVLALSGLAPYVDRNISNLIHRGKPGQITADPSIALAETTMIEGPGGPPRTNAWQYPGTQAAMNMFGRMPMPQPSLPWPTVARAPALLQAGANLYRRSLGRLRRRERQ